MLTTFHFLPKRHIHKKTEAASGLCPADQTIVFRNPILKAFAVYPYSVYHTVWPSERPEITSNRSPSEAPTVTVTGADKLSFAAS